MTDRGRRARWTAAATLSPLAAALFAGTTAWAAGHSPVTTAAPTASDSTSQQTGGASGTDAVTSELQQTLDDETARVQALEKQVTDLRAQAAAVKAGKAGTAKGAGGSGATSSRRPGTTARAGSVAGTATTRRTTTTRTTTTRTTTKPPTVHTTTGGS